MKKARSILIVVSVLLAFSSGVRAQAWPQKPIRLIVPYAAGGAIDSIARTFGPFFTRDWGQPVLVENRPGAGGHLGAEALAKSPPDGYTLLWIPTAHAVNAAIGKDVGYDPIGAFAPVTLVTANPTLVNVGQSIPYNSIKELLAAARAQPGKLSYATSGTVSSSHIAAELFRLLAGIDLLHVPYGTNGSSAMVDLIAGRTDLGMNSPVFLLPMVRAGKYYIPMPRRRVDLKEFIYAA